MTARERLESLWYRAATPPGALRAVAWLYGGLVDLRRRIYLRGMLGSVRLPVPVIVIGNIAVGGTGKTPLTIWLAEALLARGRTPGIVCRSYAARATRAAPVSGDDDPAIKGDEAVLMATRAPCPVWSGPDRAATAAAMVAAHPELDVILCDDGLQHYALARDAELAVVDGTRAFGNGRLLPAGPLREPVARLEDVDAVVLNGAVDVAGLPASVPRYAMRLAGQVAARVSDPRITAPAQTFRHARVAAIAGIGNPDRFFRHLAALGIDARAHPFPDHHRYTEDDLQRIQADFVLMTEKDAIKCRHFRDTRLWMLPVSAEVDAALIDTLLACIGNRAAHARSTNATPPRD
jgi:tetraacyldisaccharide 4'-kinase